MNNAAHAGVLRMPMTEVEGHCELHGDYVATVIVRDGKPRPAECAICQQLEIRRIAKEDQQRLLDERRSARRKVLLEGIELPSRMLETKWNDYRPANDKAAEFLRLSRQFATDWHANSGHDGNITMVGTTGTGKTHLASMIAKQVVFESNATALYTTVARMSRYVRGSFNRQSEYTQSQAVDRYIDTDLLVLDEVGLNLTSAFERGMLDEMIDERSMCRSPTVMISNLSISELEKMAERLVDRMSERGQLMVFDWASHRGQA